MTELLLLRDEFKNPKDEPAIKEELGRAYKKDTQNMQIL